MEIKGKWDLKKMKEYRIRIKNFKILLNCNLKVLIEIKIMGILIIFKAYKIIIWIIIWIIILIIIWIIILIIIKVYKMIIKLIVNNNWFHHKKIHLIRKNYIKIHRIILTSKMNFSITKQFNRNKPV